MEVWIVNPFEEFPVDGQRPLRYGTLCRVLSDRGHQVTWWSSDFSHLTKRRRKEPPVPGAFHCRLVRTPPYQRHIGWARWRNHRCFARGFYRDASRAVEEGELATPSLILVSLPPLGAAGEALRLRNRFKCRVVIDIVDAWPETFLRLMPGKGGGSRVAGRVLLAPLFSAAARAYCAADGITAVARTFLLLPKHAGSHSPTHLTYLGGEPAAYADKERDWPPLVPMRFVYIGAMGHSYDLETVMEAAARLKEKGLVFEVHLAGAGPKETMLRERMARLGIENHIIFHGYLASDDLVKLLVSSHVALNSVFEDSWIVFPYKLSEYLCAGLAVINSLPGEVKTLLEEHDAGTWYRAGDAEGLASCMESFCRQPELARRQGANAMALAEKEFIRARTYPEWAEFLEKVTAGGVLEVS